MGGCPRRRSMPTRTLPAGGTDGTGRIEPAGGAGRIADRKFRGTSERSATVCNGAEPPGRSDGCGWWRLEWRSALDVCLPNPHKRKLIPWIFDLHIERGPSFVFGAAQTPFYVHRSLSLGRAESGAECVRADPSPVRSNTPRSAPRPRGRLFEPPNDAAADRDSDTPSRPSA